MLAAERLLKSLSKIEDDEDAKYENNDYDFGEVLKLYEGTLHNQEVRYSDGESRSIVFD